jgi:hypothetical protein
MPKLAQPEAQEYRRKPLSSVSIGFARKSHPANPAVVFRKVTFATAMDQRLA